MGSGIDPKVDLAFKRVFGSPENAFVLKHLLNAVLSGSRPPLAEVEVLNPFSQQDGLSERKMILDIKARDEQGHEFLIEMQISLHPAFAERLLLYAAKTYSQQLAEGEGYNLLRPVTVVCFLNAVLFPDVPEYHGCYELRETTTHRRFSNHWQFHVVELPKFHTAVNDVAVDLERWTYFLQHGAEFDPDSLPPQLRIPEIVKATETLTMLSHTDQERELYEARLRYQRDEDATEHHGKGLVHVRSGRHAIVFDERVGHHVERRGDAEEVVEAEIHRAVRDAPGEIHTPAVRAFFDAVVE